MGSLTKKSWIEALIDSRKPLAPPGVRNRAPHPSEAEGGCGVIGIACTERVAGRHLLQSLDQMRNRGNGKGGGIAAVGLVPEEFGVTPEVLENDYLISVAYLDSEARTQVERGYIFPLFEVDHIREQPHLGDHRGLPGLEVRPPDVIQYFIRVKADVVEAFQKEHNLQGLTRRRVEDEIVYQNSFRLNTEHYSAAGESRAFVLSHGKNQLVLKMVGYGDDVIRYYQLEDLHAHVWIGHHRYPTKGRVWHPGGAHPFVGLNEALVHNGDFANYASICEYLSQRNIFPLFLTDTEVSVLVFDLLHRIYDYPLEYVIEALAPTTERDFTLLSPEKQRVYEMLQITHMHASPDGPWFFLIARSDDVPQTTGRTATAEASHPNYNLIGITDTSMLRPQVFAWQQAGNEGPAIGFAASEKQAIDAALESLAGEDHRFWTRADHYWNARGGSHTDGGAFIFTVRPNGVARTEMVCTDKFGHDIRDLFGLRAADPVGEWQDDVTANPEGVALPPLPDLAAADLFSWARDQIRSWTYADLLAFLESLIRSAGSDEGRLRAIEVLTCLMDRRYPTGGLQRSRVLSYIDACLMQVVASIQQSPSERFQFSGADAPHTARGEECQTIVVDARGFAPEGPRSLALEIVRLHELGHRKLIVANTRGHRFIGNGLGRDNHGLRIDVYGSPGDYLGSGIDGAELHVHGSTQDQVAQIVKSGKIVVHGDVGQTFMYASKGGQAYILGNAAGRPLINAVGRPRVVINGTCLDYLAESFMAGDPYNGGGFVILNGITFGKDGAVIELASPYPGGNLFSLASGGAIFVRDPHSLITPDQLNGGEFADFEARDWALIKPHLDENERLFGIPVHRLLSVNGRLQEPERVYRKIRPKSMRALQAEEAWVRKH